MNTKCWALGFVLSLAAATIWAEGAAGRHPSGSSGGSSSHSSGGGSYSSGRSSDSSSHSSGGGSYSSHGSDRSGGESHSSSASRGSSGDRHRDGGRSRGSYYGHGDRRHGGSSIRVYGGYSTYWGYYPGYDYYEPYYGGYYGWRSPGHAYHYVYDGNYGSLRLMVQPDDAEVYVDGYYAGDVDAFDGIFQRLNVRPGRHEIALKRAGYRTHRIRVYVPVGSSLRIRYEMERGTGLEPSESVVGTPETDEPAEEASTAVAAPPAPARAGELKLMVKPADAAVYIDGVFRGNADDVEEVDLAPGKHRVEVARPGYVTDQRELTLSSGQSVEQRIELGRAAAER
jgi:hypothetical protein